MDAHACANDVPAGSSPLRAVGSGSGEPGAGVFGPLGLGSEDERVYRAILTRPQTDIGELVPATELPVAAVSRTVATLERLGLVLCDRGVLSALPPEVTIGRMIAQQREALARAYYEAQSLATATQRIGTAGRTELDGPRAVALARWALVETAERDLAWAGPAGVDARSWDRANRQVRWIMARHDLEDPVTRAALNAVRRVGGRARVAADLPFGLVIADWARAVLTSSDNAHGVYLAGSPLIDLALSAFDSLWATGVPIVGDEPAMSEDRPGRDDRQLLSLLAAGAKDEATARQLGVSARTVVRRVDRLMRVLGADTRFQAGLHAARRGWL